MLYVETKPKQRENISSFLLINFNILKLKLDIRFLLYLTKQNKGPKRGSVEVLCCAGSGSYCDFSLLLDYVCGLQRVGKQRQDSQQST